MSDTATLYSEDTERSVLGGLLFRPELVGTIPLDIADFFSPKHQVVFEALRNLDESGTPVDALTVAEELRRMGRAAAVGGGEAGALGFVSELLLLCPSPDNVATYAKTLAWYAQKRRVVAVLSEALQRARTSDAADGEDVRLEALSRLQRIEARGEDPTRALGELMVAEIQAVEHDLAAADRGEWVGGMPTGIRRLDANTGGLPLGSMTLILGETGSGKSTLAMSIARAAYMEAGDIPLLFSYEDGQTSFARRALAQESGVPTWRIGARKFEPGQADRVIVEGMRRLGMRRERVAKFSGETVEQLCQTVRRLRAHGPPPGAKSIGRVVIVDYLQRIPKPRERWINSVPEAIQEISNRLEDLAASEGIAVVLFAQVTDDVKKRGGLITDVRDCADGRAGGKGCKLGLGIYRPSMYDKAADPNDAWLVVIKNNQGEAGPNVTVKVRLDLATHSIRDAEEP